MTRRIALALAVMAWTGLTASSSTPAFAQSSNSSFGRLLPKRTAFERAGLEKQWHTIVPVGSLNERVLRISLSEGLLFAQTNLGRLYAYDAETGAPIWNIKLGAVSPNAQPVAVTDQNVLVASLNKVYLINRQTGTLISSLTLPTTVNTALIARDDRVIVSRMDGVVSAFDIQLEAEPYVLTNGETVSRPFIVSGWNFGLSRPLISRPIIAKRVVAMGSQDGRVYVVRNESRELGPPRPPQTLFRFTTGGPIIGALGTLGLDTILVPSADGALYAIGLYSGELIWSFGTNGPILQEPLTSDRDIFAQNKNGQIVALDMEKFWAIEDPAGRIYGFFPAEQKAEATAKARELDEAEYHNLVVMAKAKWIRNFLPSTLIAVSPKRIYGRDSNGSLFVIGKEEGDVIVTPSAMLNTIGVDMREFKETIVNNQNDRMYFASPDGMVTCIREIGLDKPVLLRTQDPRPFGYIPRLDDPQQGDQDQGTNPSAIDAGQGTPPDPLDN